MQYHRGGIACQAARFGRWAAAIATSLTLAVAATGADAASAEAGKAKAEPCTACHGENGISVADDVPNLAGQKAKYIEAQLKAFKAGKRKNPLMNAIAPQLSDADIADVAAFFSGLPGAPAGTAKSAFMPSIANTHVGFPEGYKDTFTRYHSINFPDRKQVRDYFVDNGALAALKTGKPLPNGSMVFVEVYAAKLQGSKPVLGADGFYVRDKLTLYTAMKKDAGWGKDIPGILRNGDWNYAVFTTDKKLKGDVNLATCFACHKPLDKDDFLFTIKEIKAKAK